MRQLVLIRHAKSDWSTGEPDHDRPLNPRGLLDAPAAGVWLAEHVSPPEVALVSSARRTQMTWALIESSWGAAGLMTTRPEVYEASARTLMRVVEAIPADVERAVLVGHNPGITDLCALLAGGDHVFKTSSIAVLEVDAPWPAARGNSTVVQFVTPRGESVIDFRHSDRDS